MPASGIPRLLRAELAARLGDRDTVQDLREQVRALPLTDADRATLAADVAALDDLPVD